MIMKKILDRIPDLIFLKKYLKNLCTGCLLNILLVRLCKV